MIMTLIFVLEAAMKIVSCGFVGGKKSYLRNGWNMLDFAIVLVSLLNIFSGTSSEFSSFRTFRVLRALRPLRVVSKNPGTITCIVPSLPV